MLKMNPQKFHGVLIVITIAASIFGALAYGYAISLVIQKGHKLAEQTQLRDSSALLTTSSQDTIKKYNQDVKPYLTNIETALPRTKNQSGVLSDFKKTAAENGVSISAISFDKSMIEKNGLTTTPISFSAKGNFGQLQSFLGNIENLSRLTSVKSLLVAGSGAKITYTIKLNIYHLEQYND